MTGPRLKGPAVRRLALLACLALTACDVAAPSSPTPAQTAAHGEAVAARTPEAATLVAVPEATPTLPPASTATATLVPPPTSTPAPVVRQLTTGGCCVQPGWSPDGSQVWYIDRPDAASPSGLWGVGLDGGPPVFVTDRLGIYSPDRSLLAFPEGGQTIIERLATGERWVAPTAGRSLSFSPNGQLIAWSIASSTRNFDRRLVEVWVARVDGQEARLVAQLRGGGFAGWFPDSQRMLINGRDEAQAAAGNPDVEFIGVLNLADGSVQPLVQSENLRGTSLSPEGGWLLYTVAFSGDPAADGQWVMPVAGGEPRRLETYGATRWRAEGRLLVIPVEWTSASGFRVLEVDAASGVARPLTDPAVTPLPIGGGDWALAPDGRRLVFVSAEDHNLWLLELPD